MADHDTTLCLTTRLLNGSNYRTWSRLVMIALRGEAKFGWVSGEIKCPTDGKDPNFPTKLKEWNRVDSLVMLWLLNSMEPNIANLFLYEETSAKMWEAIRKMYGPPNTFAHLFQIKQELAQLKQKPGQSIADFTLLFKSKLAELKFYQPPTTDLKEIEKRMEQESVFQFLLALDSSFEPVVNQILLSPESQSLERAISLVKQFECIKNVMNQANSSIETEFERNALAVTYGGGNNLVGGDHGRGRGKGGPTSKCEHCNRTGHDQASCWFLHPHLRPNRDKKHGVTGGKQEMFNSNNHTVTSAAAVSFSSSNDEQPVQQHFTGNTPVFTENYKYIVPQNSIQQLAYFAVSNNHITNCLDLLQNLTTNKL